MRSKPTRSVQPWTWTVTLTRARGQYLETVETADLDAAEAVAIQSLLSDDQRKRLLLRELA
jgi:hypothetical protein